MTTYRVVWTPTVPPAPVTSDEARFWAKVELNGDTGCWEWTAALRDGYGRFWLAPRVQAAHRVAYQWLVGPIADGLHLDHLCRNTRCVNPAHLEPVTQRENLMRGVSGEVWRSGLCARGHRVPQGADRGGDCQGCNTLRAARRRKRLGIVQGKGVRLVPAFSPMTVAGTHDPVVATATLAASGVDTSGRNYALVWLRTLPSGRIMLHKANGRGNYQAVVFE